MLTTKKTIDTILYKMYTFQHKGYTPRIEGGSDGGFDTG
jgi:hypothetical protein